jgi:hypothetical protein
MLRRWCKPPPIIKSSGYRLLMTLDGFDDFVDSQFSAASGDAGPSRDPGAHVQGPDPASKKSCRATPTSIGSVCSPALPEDKVLELQLRERAAVESFTMHLPLEAR